MILLRSRSVTARWCWWSRMTLGGQSGDEETFAVLGHEPAGVPTRSADARAGCLEAPERFDAMVVGHLSSAAAALDLAAELHEIAPGLPILPATASSDDFGANALVTAGISDVVAWPIIATEMALALQNCLHRGPLPDERGSTRQGGGISRYAESGN